MGNIKELLKKIAELEQENSRLKNLQNKDSLELILQEMPVGVGITDLQGNISFLNKRFTELFGYTKEEIPSTAHWFPLAYPDKTYREKLITVWGEGIQKSLKTGIDPTPIEVEVKTKEGKILNIIVSYKISADSVITIFNDLTEEKRTTTELQKTKQLLEIAIDQSPAGIILANAPGIKIQLANAAVLNMQGAPDSNLSLPELNAYIKSWQTFHSDGTPFLFNDLPLARAIIKGEEVKNVDVIIRNKKGIDKWVLANAAPVKSSEGDIIAGIVVFQDITAGKLAEIKLLESQLMLQAVLDAIPVRVFWKDLNSVYLGCNRTFAKDANLNSVLEIQGKNDFDLPWKDNEAELFRTDDKQVIQTQKSKLNYEEPQTHEDGEKIWLRTSKMPLKNHKGEIIGVMGTYEDITDRKKAEDALLESERNYREIFNSSVDAIFILDAKTGAVLDVNNTMLKMFECTYTESLDSTLNVFSQGKPPYDEKAVSWYIQKVIETGEEKFIWHSKTAKGNLFWTEVNLKRITLNAGQRILAVVRDMTERINAENAIAYRHSLEKLIYSISARFINLMVDDVDINITKAFRELCDFTNTDFIYMYLYSSDWNSVSHKYLWHRDHITGDKNRLSDFASGTDHWHFQQIRKYREIRISDLSQIPINESLIKKNYESFNIQAFTDVALFYQGNIIGFLGIGSSKNNRIWLDDEIYLLKVVGDIFLNSLQRKESVAALQENEQTYREIFNATSEAIFIHDADTGEIVDVNETMLNMFGYNFEEAVTLKLDKLTLVDDTYSEEIALNLIKNAVTKPQVFEWRSKRSDDSAFWAEVSLRGADIHGKKRVLAVVRDITERKMALQRIAESEGKYRLLVEAQSDLVVKFDTKGMFQFVSPSYCEVFNKSEEELIGSNFLYPVHDDDKKNIQREKERLFYPPYSCTYELRAITKVGWRWFSWKDKSILDEKNEVIEIVAVGRDITYQKEVETVLRESEDRFRTLIQQLSDMVLVLDENLIINFETPSAISILGYAEGYLLGREIADFIYNDERELFKEKMKLLLDADNEVQPSEFRVHHANGQLVHLEIVGNNMLNHPAVNGLVITCRNITERKLLEKRILDAIIKTEEKEREHFAKNLHDDLGPLLSSIKMYLGMIGTITDKQKSEFIIEQLNDIVKEAIITTKDVSNDLSPHILNNYGLVSAIETFIKKISSQIKIDFSSSIENNRYSTILETSFYRISKELINNTLKHANASVIELTLKEEKSSLILNYKDNGKGFPENLLNKNLTGGMGLSNIISRSKSLNAVYEFSSKPGKGFNFFLKAPIVQD